MMPSSGVARMSSTSSIDNISPRAARAVSNRVIRRCFCTCSPFSAFTVLESSIPMIRSESRTDDTSGLVTTTASSAKRIASIAPRSMPAGLSQMIQSNLVRNSAMILPTPSSVSASLSRVCEAGNSHRFSRRLSRMRACERLAMPCTTLMKSNTTRRSAPSTRSRLRRPTSKSTTTTFSPICASAAPSAAVDVVLPTPPLPDVTTRTLAILSISPNQSIQRCNLYDFAVEPDLRRPRIQGGVDFFCRSIVTIDGQKLGFDFVAVNARAQIAIDAGHRPAAERAIDMDGAARDDFCARADRSHHRDVSFRKHDRLAGTHLGVEQQGCRFGFHLRLLRRIRRDHTMTAAIEQRRQARRQARGVDALDAEHAKISLCEVRDQLRNCIFAEVDRGEIEHHGLAGKKSGRLTQRCVNFLKPIHDGDNGVKHKSDIRSPSHANGLWLWQRDCIHDNCSPTQMTGRGRCSRANRPCPRVMKTEVSRRAKLSRKL